MPDHPGAGRLDPETLAAYVDGLLPPEERAKVDAEIAADPENFEWLVNTIGAVDDDTIQVLPFQRRRAVRSGVWVLLAAAASALLVVQLQPEWWQHLRGPQADPRFATLVAAVGHERYLEARLSGGFEYGPPRQVMRGPTDLSTQNHALLAAAGELQKAADANPSPENLHAWGVAQLLLGAPDLALVTLTAALAKESSHAVAIDLAAAYLSDGAPSEASLGTGRTATGPFGGGPSGPGRVRAEPRGGFQLRPGAGAGRRRRGGAPRVGSRARAPDRRGLAARCGDASATTATGQAVTRPAVARRAAARWVVGIALAAAGGRGGGSRLRAPTRRQSAGRIVVLGGRTRQPASDRRAAHRGLPPR